MTKSNKKKLVRRKRKERKAIMNQREEGKYRVKKVGRDKKSRKQKRKKENKEEKEKEETKIKA